MVLGPQGYVSIVELIVYIPALVTAIIVTSRHGFHRASGWIYTVILCVVRIAGAICQLLSYTDHSDGLLKATLIIDSIGLSPLLLATLGVLSRFADFVNAKGTQIFGMKQFRLVQLLITLGLILSIAGGSDGSTDSDGNVTISGTSKAAIILLIVGFAGITYFFLLSSGYKTAAPRQERHSLVAVGIAWPLILVRLAYSALAIFVHNHTFSVVGGSVAVHAGMAVVEEFLVVLDYLILGFMLHKLEPEEQGELANRAWKNKKRTGNDRR
ncbi:uncharacterized protein TRIVIDRAFT_221423 [Trichoderma virens Gv29-8]|uniref:DUF7702 domain-containing protein n=1 Tax=Hypocrea virens (strain Gv29-8 / FGSC 10586) TaxID=413071 RepID=G9MSC2_HYPVG|nr:uncharacterized protein TRIVIDRAFT_221423 [Trichoderma virens Gv29-8]EHK22139.1 hypothetical protein TRIVIDRAFT_221423 [Trichoderma virens Gv29-8]UKZ47170.1 hypothetical protein TrVGV298_001384 [Trichoderma virens]